MGAGRAAERVRQVRDLVGRQVGRQVGSLRRSELLDLVLPRECGGCLRPGEEWCARCARALAALAFVDPGDTPGHIGGAPWVVPHRAPGGMPAVYAWGIYADPLRAVMSAWKDGGRRDLVRVLEPLLTASVVGALEGLGWVDGGVLVVPAPSSRRARRQRGDTPMEDLCLAAATSAVRGQETGSEPGADVGSDMALRVAPALRHVRRVEDQSGLGTAARRGNLTGALSVKPLWHNVVRGRRCLLVDDVVTTGATLAEAARALREAGAGPVVGATIAATQRTRG
ncbi:MAG: ComF family protein [Dermatophilaceae bacterium]|nr:ComF family protein [Dermatophilaceae bacterium]